MPLSTRASWCRRSTSRVRSFTSPVAVTLSAYPDGGYALRVTATGLVKDLTLLVDRLHPDARVDSGMVTLSAGDSHTFQIESDTLDPAGLSAATVLRSANDLVVQDSAS